MATDYRGRVAEVKDHDSPYFACTGIVREVKNGLFTVELPEGNLVFERRELRIKRPMVEDTYDIELDSDEERGAGVLDSDEVEADSAVDAVMQATGGEEYAKIRVTKGSSKNEPGKSHTRPRTEPKTAVRNTLEALGRLNFPYTITLPAAYAPLLEKKTKGIYGLDMKKKFGRIFIKVETVDALNNLYNKLDTKRPSAQSKTILEGIRRSAR